MSFNRRLNNDSAVFENVKDDTNASPSPPFVTVLSMKVVDGKMVTSLRSNQPSLALYILVLETLIL